MRDSAKNENYFKSVIVDIEKSSTTWLTKVANGEIPVDRINYLKRSISWSLVTLIAAKYSFGYPSNDLLGDYMRASQLIHESWDGFWKLKNRDGKEYDQYTLSPYDEMLWMLSLGYLLNAPNEEYSKLVSVIDQDKVRDKLYEFIITAKITDRAPLKEESYREYFGIPQVFATLRLAIEQQNKKEAERLIKLFLEKEWYKNHKDAGWYNTHKSKHNVYVGYWCFESAAVVKIMGLDDSSFRDNKYYPKDIL